MDSEEIRRLTEALQRTSQAVEKSMTGIARASRDAMDEGKSFFETFNKQWADGLKDTTADVSKNWSTNMIRAVDQVVDHFRGEMQRTTDEFKTRAVTGNDQAGGMFEGLRRLTQGVLAGLPMSGMLGLMLYGRMREAEFVAQAQRATQLLRQAGDTGSGVLQELSGDIRGLGISIPDIASNFSATTRTLAEFGYTASDAMSSTRQDIIGVKDNVLTLTAAIERHFELAAGRASQLGIAIANNTNTPLARSVELVAEIGERVQNTGIGFNQMTASVMQATSALRLQGQEQQQVLDFVSLTQRAQAGFMGQGMNAQRAGQFASESMSGIAQVIANLSDGFKAELGKMMGIEGDGVQRIRGFERGALSGDTSQLAATFEAILKMSREATDNEAEQSRFLKLMNFNAEQAETLLAVQKANDEGLELQRQIQDSGSGLARAFLDEGLKQSTFTTAMRTLQDAVITIGTSLITLIRNGLESILISLQYLSDPSAWVTKRSAYQKAILDLGNQSDRAGSDASAAVKRMMKAVGGQAKEFIGARPDSVGKWYDTYMPAKTKEEKKAEANRAERSLRALDKMGSFNLELEAELPGVGPVTLQGKLRQRAARTVENIG